MTENNSHKHNPQNMVGHALLELHSTPSSIIHERLMCLSKEERKITAELIEYLAQVDMRRIYLELGFQSLFDYVTRGLGYSEGSAMRRINAARMLKTVSEDTKEIQFKIESGSIKLTQLSETYQKIKVYEKEHKTKLTKEHKSEIIQVLQNKTNKETEKVLAEMFQLKAIERTEIRTKHNERVEIRFSLSKEEYELIENIKQRLSHSVPSNDIKDLILYLCHKTRKNMDRAESTTTVAVKPMSKASIAKLKSKSDHQCSHVHRFTKKRCDSKSFLEIDHVTPKAWGGANASGNLRVLCREHNQYEALQRRLL